MLEGYLCLIYAYDFYRYKRSLIENWLDDLQPGYDQYGNPL
jgi:hypothetical protein